MRIGRILILIVACGLPGGCGNGGPPQADVDDPMIADTPSQDDIRMDDRPVDDLVVDLGMDIALDGPASVEVSADVSGESPDARLVFTWSYATGSRSRPDGGALTPDTPEIVVNLAALVDAEALARGTTVIITVEVREVLDDGLRMATDDLRIVIAPPDGEDSGDPPPPGDDEPLEQPDDPGENGDDGLDLEDAEGADDTAVDDTFGLPNDTPGPGGTNPIGPCGTGSVLTTIMDTELHMSMFEGTLSLQPTICNGVAPLTYAWGPIELFQDDGGALDGPSGVVDTLQADFQPTAVGDYVVTLTVTDAVGDTSVFPVTIHVNDFDPLIASAGPDQVVAINTPLGLQGSASGGSGQYIYQWQPSGINTPTMSVDTTHIGQRDFTLMVTDALTGTEASAEASVVVTATGAGGCVEDDVTTGFGSARFVEYDPGFGAAGQALVASGTTVKLIDLSTEATRATLTLPSDVTGVVLDTVRRRAMVATRLPAAFTRSVQVIDLDGATLGANIGLVDTVAAARGMAVIPSTGRVLVAVSGAINGLIEVDPGTTSVTAAVLNMHHDASFFQPIDVAVVDNGGIATAVVANASAPGVTLVPLSAVIFDPTMPPGGGVQAPLPIVTTAGSARAIVADGSSGRCAVAINNGDQGRVQVIQLTDAVTGAAGPITELGAAVGDLALDGDGQGSVVAATGAGGAVVVLLDFAIVAGTLDAGLPARDAAFTDDVVLIVGNGSTMGRRCP